jgi:hypothetical protein
MTILTENPPAVNKSVGHNTEKEALDYLGSVANLVSALAEDPVSIRALARGIHLDLKRWDREARNKPAPDTSWSPREELIVLIAELSRAVASGKQDECNLALDKIFATGERTAVGHQEAS